MASLGEEKAALLEARKLLHEFLDSRQAPRVPKHIRRRAEWIVKHLPSEDRIAGLFSERAQSGRPSPAE
jgi:hypothetical protein